MISLGYINTTEERYHSEITKYSARAVNRTKKGYVLESPEVERTEKTRRGWKNEEG